MRPDGSRPLSLIPNDEKRVAKRPIFTVSINQRTTWKLGRCNGKSDRYCINVSERGD